MKISLLGFEISQGTNQPGNSTDRHKILNILHVASKADKGKAKELIRQLEVLAGL